MQGDPSVPPSLWSVNQKTYWEEPPFPTPSSGIQRWPRWQTTTSSSSRSMSLRRKTMMRRSLLSRSHMCLRMNCLSSLSWTREIKVHSCLATSHFTMSTWEDSSKSKRWRETKSNLPILTISLQSASKDRRKVNWSPTFSCTRYSRGRWSAGSIHWSRLSSKSGSVPRVWRKEALFCWHLITCKWTKEVAATGRTTTTSQATRVTTTQQTTQMSKMKTSNTMRMSQSSRSHHRVTSWCPSSPTSCCLWRCCQGLCTIRRTHLPTCSCRVSCVMSIRIPAQTN